MTSCGARSLIRTRGHGARCGAWSCGTTTTADSATSPTWRWKRSLARNPNATADIVLDTDGLADFLAQYFGRANRRSGRFVESAWLSHRAAQEINRIMDFFLLNEWVKDYVIGSTFAFMEIVR